MGVLVEHYENGLSELRFETGRLLVGDALARLREIPDCSVGSVVTDPPYELAFMGKSWDASGIAYNVELWREVLRVLKPGGHLVAFGGSRTYHRLACAIEDAGFSIRDGGQWWYGSGFPKSLSVDKAIDKAGGNPLAFRDFAAAYSVAVAASGLAHSDIDKLLGVKSSSCYWARTDHRGGLPPRHHWEAVRDLLTLPTELGALYDEAEREVVGARSVPVGHAFAGEIYGGDSSSKTVDVTAPSTDAAKQWAGWGTALKPANEPWVLARKPLDGTVAANVLKWGVGALNIDGTRVGNHVNTTPSGIDRYNQNYVADGANRSPITGTAGEAVGRWPANVILTHSAACTLTGTAAVKSNSHHPAARGKGGVSTTGHTGQEGLVERTPGSETVDVWACAPDCPVAALDAQAGKLKSGANPTRRGAETGGASRFYPQANWDADLDATFIYQAKPSKKERNAGLDGLPTAPKVFNGKSAAPSQHVEPGSVEAKFATTPQANTHPTVKPVALMRHLIRTVTPPGETTLDLFAGSGTSAIAAIAEGVPWIGVELTEDYVPIIAARVRHAEKQAANTRQDGLF